jgi:hypothetical protein
MVELKVANKLHFLCCNTVNFVSTYCCVSVVDPGHLGVKVCVLHLNPAGPLLKGPQN